MATPRRIMGTSQTGNFSRKFDTKLSAKNKCNRVRRSARDEVALKRTTQRTNSCLAMIFTQTGITVFQAGSVATAEIDCRFMESSALSVDTRQFTAYGIMKVKCKNVRSSRGKFSNGLLILDSIIEYDINTVYIGKSKFENI